MRRQLELVPGTKPALIFAGVAPKPEEVPSGGRVKLAQLARFFPDGNRRGNILYLVSSALPPTALAWARTARACGFKVVLNQNGVAFPAWADESTRMRINGRNRALAELADWIFFQSEFCRESFGRWVGEVKVGYSILHNPVDVENFHAEGSRDCDILLMGSASQPERIRLALATLAEARRLGYFWRMRVAGKMLWPCASTDVLKWVRELGLLEQVEWLGPYSQADAPRIFASASVLLHLQDKDASPTVPLEAMACGTPVLGLRSGGMPELVPDLLGKLLPVTEKWESFNFPEPKAVAEGLAELLARAPQLRSDCAAHVARNFSLEFFRQSHVDLFYRLLGKGNGGAA